MYQSFNTKSAAYTVNGKLGSFGVQSGPDGLQVDTSQMTLPVTASIPPRLYDWLLDLRLLRNLPLSYLVPDSALLPAEAIRFFHVDPTWVDRVIDGVFSAANTGTVDVTYSAAMLQSIRVTLDLGLAARATEKIGDSKWTPADGMTGMLIRSDLVRRWPDVIVSAFAGNNDASKELPVLRAEPLSKEIYIAIFAGTPGLVQLREPHVGVRFGLETTDQKTYFYEQRNADDGKATGAHTNVALKPGRVVPVRSIAGDSRTVAIELMRQPYIQQFVTSVKEPRGSQNAPLKISPIVGRVMNTAGLTARLAELERLGKS